LSLDRLEITPFAVLIGEIIGTRQSGTQLVAQGHIRRTLCWANGDLVLATSESPDDSLAAFLIGRGVIEPSSGGLIAGGGPEEEAARFQELPLEDGSQRQPLLREWLTSLVQPLFTMEEGTAVFTSDAPLDPMKRIFLPSMPGFVLEGVRSITSGLMVRRALGDLQREIIRSTSSTLSIEMLPLTAAEASVAAALTDPLSIDALLKKFSADSLTAARVVIALLALGIFVNYDRKAAEVREEEDTMRDLLLLAAIGPDDVRSLRAVRLSKELPRIDHYRVLDVPRAATRPQIILRGEEVRRLYEASTYPAAVREFIDEIRRRVEEAIGTLRDPMRRAEYDRLLTAHGGENQQIIQQKLTQHVIAEQNFSRAQEMAITGDYYGAIVLLKQAVNYSPRHQQAWYLLGCCQERNPQWRRDAVESFQKALGINPNEIDTLISLGDLYRTEGMASRAQACYEDALRINPDHPEAISRLKKMKK